MSHPIAPIAMNDWRYRATGRIYTNYGTPPVPPTQPGLPEDYTLQEPQRWNVQNSDGTIGAPEGPWATEAEAQAYVDAHQDEVPIIIEDDPA